MKTSSKSLPPQSNDAAKARTMIVAGVMSGTSADGVDVALCRIAPRSNGVPRVKVLAHRGFPYRKPMRLAVLRLAAGEASNAGEIARLSWRLGSFYADCVRETVAGSGVKIDLVSCHGQTIYHQGDARVYLWEQMRCTWQIGEPSLIAERLGVPVISDLRPADMAAGGQGAPLVPILDFYLFQHAKKNRMLLNLGGIANITALPAACGLESVLAFDTGPANMVIDAAMQRLYARNYDRNGTVAARGKVLGGVVKKLMDDLYFSAPPPKSCGREQFGAAFVDRLFTLCEKEHASPQDVIATATDFTVESILDAYRRFCWPWLGQHAPMASATELFAAGGGARNRTLLRTLDLRLKQIGIRVQTTEVAGVAVEAKEAAAFALLGWLTWHGLPGNVPSVTGATRPVVLGRVSYAL